MTSKYLKCNNCGKTLGAEEVIKHRTPGKFDSAELVKAAREAGWTGDMSDWDSIDLCPDCSPRPSEKEHG